MRHLSPVAVAAVLAALAAPAAADIATTFALDPHPDAALTAAPDEEAMLAERSCAELYDEITGLLTRTPEYQTGFFQDPRNQAVGAAATVYPPAVVLLGVTAALGYQAHLEGEAAVARIAVLRRASADKRCWVR